VVPLLNGMRHIDVLAAKFGDAKVVGGLARVGVTLSPDGAILHTSPFAAISFGERDGKAARPALVELDAAAVTGTAAAPDTVSADALGSGWFAAAIAPVRPITADAARPLAAMRLPAAACLRRGADRRAWSAAILSACSASVVIDAPFGRGCGSCRCCYRQQSAMP